ncbi:MAG TPA: hypothetical protein VGD10_07425 [Allosphingosinicella sp.]|uniref:hypothetical protein n=1 Tax=Allosphingosinicella sp. TaxID=2823234 RepID=UPI002ED87537
MQPSDGRGKRPVLIWARGGIGDVAQGEGQFVQMAGWVRRGYIVIGSIIAARPAVKDRTNSPAAT